ncbi:hypothetical protein EQW78_12275 [Oerskovia turbata]|uniref:Uncharacterized protein n=1 Tax=Oerskovia turbata TaxID=1713 RepID=A0A4Q1KTB0_9CELL|nr:hypothetical protein [Oerskovia turbata]RXR25660.1 hypothetical protein EQW73_09070 [Oerskovia turbata]RXR33252.1 hypothetical protein EQW78_12275 [Oerskovia turbata]TGJ96322.1 hypothetical protein DLJ96_11375 [Actinotalea fermentans ATCC 43279 = JCM 9966 = DSM 3133]
MRLVPPLLLVGLVVLLVVALNISRRVSAGDVRWIAGTADVPPAQADVYRRYLARHRQHRMVGGLLGTALGVLLGLRWNATIPLDLVLFCGVTGVLVGSLSAETYRLSRPRAVDGVAPSLRTASLTPRPPLEHGRVLVTARVLLAVALLVGLVGVIAGQTAPLLVALTGVVVAAVAERTQSVVRSRRRPVVSPDAAAVDHRIRAFASRSLAWLEAGAATLTVSQVLASVPVTSPPLAAAQTFLSITLLVTTFVLVHRASPQRPWSLILRPTPALPSSAGAGGVR